MEKTNNYLTAKEVIEMTINELRSLSIPADMLDTFGPPISRSLNNLRQVVLAMGQAESKDVNKPETTEEESVEELIDEVSDDQE